MQLPVHYTQCPVCGSAGISFALSAKDHTVTGDTFSIFECASCTLRFTQDVPSQDMIGIYYRAETYISHTNTSKGLINRLYQAVRKKTLRQKSRMISKWTGQKNGHVLDLGAGAGAFVNTMKTAGWEVTGLEPDPIARDTAQKDFNILLQDTSGFYDLPGKYDAITMWHVLEHVHDLNGYMKKLKAILAPAGKLFIAVPNYTSKDAEVYGSFWAAWDVPRHLYHFSPEAMQQLAAKHGFTIIQKLPMWYDSFYVSMLSSKYKSGRTRLLSSLWTGLQSNLAAGKNAERCSSVIYILESR